MAVIYALLRVRLNNVQNVFVHQKINHRRNRHYFSANGPFLLLPLALKWGLFSILALFILPLVYGTDVSAAELNITIPTDPLLVTVSADGSAKESSPANVTVTSDAYWGYTLSVKSNDANGALTNGNSKINSIGTGITSLSQFTNNTWGFKVSGEGITAPNNYRQGPTTATTNLAITTGQKGSQETGTYSFTLATKVDNTIPAGTYTGTFTFMATANSVNYTINFNMRNGTGGPSTMSSQTENATVKLASSVPTNGDHVFLGWCDQEVTGNGPCNGTIYQPDENYVLKSADESATLYAMYDGDTVYMQNWKGCSKYLTKNVQFTLTDKRDNKKYFVAKLADDNCWMTENLDYDVVANIPLTSETTDLGYANADGTSNVGGNGNYQWTPDKSTYETQEYASYREITTIQESYDPGDRCWNGVMFTYDVSNGLETRTTACSQHDPTHWHLGNYYNYGAAVAQNDTSSKKVDGEKYDTSVCPAGWRLPEKGGDPSYPNLFNKSKDNGHEVTIGQGGNIDKVPFYLFYAGGANYNSAWQIGLKGLYRSNAVSGTVGSYALETHLGSMSFGMSNPGPRRAHAFPVRCVARS